MARGILIVSSRPVDRAHEDAYNDWYTNTHIPEMLQAPGFVGARRYKPAGEGDYLAIYDLESDDLAATVAGMSARRNERTRSDALQTDPPPTVALYELLD